jgi:hypothetical protein
LFPYIFLPSFPVFPFLTEKFPRLSDILQRKKQGFSKVGREGAGRISGIFRLFFFEITSSPGIFLKIPPIPQNATLLSAKPPVRQQCSGKITAVCRPGGPDACREQVCRKQVFREQVCMQDVPEEAQLCDVCKEDARQEDGADVCHDRPSTRHCYRNTSHSSREHIHCCNSRKSLLQEL